MQEANINILLLNIVPEATINILLLYNSARSHRLSATVEYQTILNRHFQIKAGQTQEMFHK